MYNCPSRPPIFSRLSTRDSQLSGLQLFLKFYWVFNDIKLQKAKGVFFNVLIGLFITLLRSQILNLFGIWLFYFPQYRQPSTSYQIRTYDPSFQPPGQRTIPAVVF